MDIFHQLEMKCCQQSGCIVIISGSYAISLCDPGYRFALLALLKVAVQEVPDTLTGRNAVTYQSTK